MNRCQPFQDRLLAYVHDELNTRDTRQMARHLQSCEACYALYVHERDAAREFERELHLLGTPRQEQLNMLWASVSAELEKPQPISRPISYQLWQHGLAAAVLMVVCLLPWSLSVGELAQAAVPLGATPVIEPNTTPEGTEEIDASQKIALNAKLPTEDALNPTPTSTPAIAPSPQIVIEQQVR